MSEPLLLICGVDEAGRGPLAGPVFAACVILDPGRQIRGLADSKVLAPERREVLQPGEVRRRQCRCGDGCDVGRGHDSTGGVSGVSRSDGRLRHRTGGGRRRGPVGGGSARGHGWRLNGGRRGAGARSGDAARVRSLTRARTRARAGPRAGAVDLSRTVHVGTLRTAVAARARDGVVAVPPVLVPVARAGEVARDGRARGHGEDGERQQCQGCEDAPRAQGVSPAWGFRKRLKLSRFVVVVPRRVDTHSQQVYDYLE